MIAGYYSGRRPMTRTHVTLPREDDHQPKAYLIHEGCQSAMLRDLPFDDESKP